MNQKRMFSTSNEWHSLYLGKFVKSIPAYIASLASEYHHRTESFDRSVCTGPIRNGSILPANGKELGIINRHAKNVLKEVMSRVDPEKQRLLMDAIGNFHFYS